MKKLLLVDGNSLLNRAYYATTLTNGAVYGFLNMFLKALQDTGATHAAVTFDVRAKTFRHKMYTEYKANRKPMPEDLAAQLADLKKILNIMHITMFEKEGYEADDIIGTISRLASAEQVQTIILTADRDCLQLISDNTEVHLTKTGVTLIEVYDKKRIEKEFGVSPKQLIDIKALMGDKSDNIPGAAGVGEKTALGLIKQFGSVENLLESIDSYPKLVPSKDLIIKSRELAEIKCDVEIEFSIDKLAFALPMSKPVFNAFKERAFHSLCRRDNLWDADTATTNTVKIPVQQSFFDISKGQETHLSTTNDTLSDILLKMHENGAKIDLMTSQKVIEKYLNEISELSKQIYVFAGEEFNINSPKQLSNILYKKLGIETMQKTKNGVSTNEAILFKVKNSNPIVSLILKYRKVQKMRSYVQGIIDSADAGGFIHPVFAANTATGRLSSVDPNIQNIPARTDDAAEIRALFISRFNGGKILCADYSQIELRILAHLSGDKTMQNAFLSGRDFHDETAKLLGIDRRTAKAVNFGVTYGQTPFGLAQTLDISVGDATRFIENYFARFPSVKEYLDKTRDDAIVNGFSQDLFGNRRVITELNSTNQHILSAATRAAINMPMQGSAAEIIKRAMIAIDTEIQKQSLKSVLIDQIHDELVYDCPEAEVTVMSSIVRSAMENVIKLDVTLVVNIDAKPTL